MPSNTVHGPYSPLVWSQGSTPLSSTNMNHLETQADVALNGFNGDLLSPFVLSGITCSKNGSTANQLDVTSGRAYVKLSNSTIGLIATVASTPGQFITSTPSTTYHLYLQPDGTWYWSTSNTPATNSLAIADVATDVSGNIATVTDKRPLNTTLLSGVGGLLGLGGSGMAYADAVGNLTGLALIASRALGGATRILQKWVATDGHTWTLSQDVSGNLLLADTNTGKQWTFGNGGAFVIPGNLFSVGGQATVGSLGVSTVVRKIDDQVIAVTTETLLTSLTVPADAWYRISYSFNYSNPTPQKVIAKVSWTDPSAGGAAQNYFQDNFQGQLLSGSQTTAMANNQMVTCAPIPLRVKSGTTFGVYFQDPGGTPNDKVSLLIERLT